MMPDFGFMEIQTAMREAISHVMARHIGQTLTPERAIEMVREMFPDRSIDLLQFGVLAYKGYTIQAERFREVLPELDALHAAHWAETERHRISVPMNPDTDYMADREHAGGLIQFTARDDAGRLVGNMRVYISRDMHAQQLVCTEDTLYLLPEHRGGFLAVRLWQFVEKAVVSLGVREVRFSSKLANKAHRLATYLKYRPVGTEFVKVFDEAGNPAN